jgi:hydrogenase/urease accessory protein HupE
MWKTRWLAGLVWLGFSNPAYAHSPIPGIEGFYVGLLHPFSTPSQAILMLGLGLLISGLRQSHYPPAFGIFLFSMLATLFIGPLVDNPDVALFASAALVGAMAAIWPKTYLPVALAVVAVGGFLIGQVSIPDPGPMRDRIITMAGSFVGANIGLLYVAGGAIFLKERFNQHWVEVAFRVVSAWLGAVALVMLALQLALDDAKI